MFKDEDLKNPDFNVIEILKSMTDQQINNECTTERRNGVTLLALIAKYRSEEEFTFLVGRMSTYSLEMVLPKMYAVLVRGADAAEIRNSRMTTLHMILAHQSFDAILCVLRLINTAVLYQALTAENTIAEADRISWKKLTRDNKNFNNLRGVEAPNKKIKQDEGLPERSPEKSPELKAQLLIKSLEEFIELTESCKSLVTKNPRKFVLEGTKLTLELLMTYRDTQPEYLGWNLLQFVCQGISKELSDQVAVEEMASKIIRNLKQELLSKIRLFRCQDPQYQGCNLLHFVLLHVKKMDDVQTFCSKADDETLNAWMCDRMQVKFKYQQKIPMRDFSALQMMMLHLNMPSLKYMMTRLTPKTLYTALKFRPPTQLNSDNIIPCEKLLEMNPNVKAGPNVEGLKQQIYGIRLFYELYDYFVQIGNKRDLTSRIVWVRKLMHFIENPPEDYTFNGKLNLMCGDFKPFEKVFLLHLNIRPFKDIILDICTERRVSTIKEGYEACKELYHELFMPVAAVAQAPAPAPERRSPSPKKVVISTPDNEVFEYKKGT